MELFDILAPLSVLATASFFRLAPKLHYPASVGLCVPRQLQIASSTLPVFVMKA